jgi:hypothetical protein
MASKNGNGGAAATSSSYQKYDGASGTYQPVDGSDFEDLNSNNGSSSTSSRSGNKWKILAAVGVALAAALGAYYTVTSPAKAGRSDGGSSQQQIDKAISSSGSGLQVKSNGRLKLFDSLSTFSSSEYCAVLCLCVEA